MRKNDKNDKNILVYFKASIYEAKYSRMDQVKSVADNCLGRPYHFKSFQGCLPQSLLGPFLNTLPHIYLH